MAGGQLRQDTIDHPFLAERVKTDTTQHHGIPLRDKGFLRFLEDRHTKQPTGVAEPDKQANGHALVD